MVEESVRNNLDDKGLVENYETDTPIMNCTSNTRLTGSKSLVTILFLGVLGSCLWDVLIKHIVYKFGNLFFTLMISIHSGYVDTLYRDVGSQANIFLYIPSFVIFAVSLTFPFIVYMQLRRLFKAIDKLVEPIETHISKFDEWMISLCCKKRKLLYITVVGGYAVLSILFIDEFIRWVSCQGAVNYIERSIEIVRPALSEDKYIKIRSDFRQIDNAEKTQLVISELFSIADDNGYVLPELRLYGIVAPPPNK